MPVSRVTEQQKLDVARAALSAYLKDHPGANVDVVVGSFTNEDGSPKVWFEPQAKDPRAPRTFDA